MLVLFSHLLAFSVLFIAAVSDLKTTEVPDILSVVGVVGGLLLHAAASYQSGMSLSALMTVSLLVDSPLVWVQGLGEPLMWSLGIGLLFSLYGWTLYFLGMWGGADAFAMSVLGFAAPYSLLGPGITHAVNLFLNIMIVGFVYTILFALYKSYQNQEVWRDTWNDIKDEELRISLEVLVAAVLSSIGLYTGAFNGYIYFVSLVLLILAYRFLRNVQYGLMSHKISVSELEGGEVLARGEEEGGKVKGITEEEIEELEADKVEIREGVRFVPVFPVALLLTDVVGGGIYWISLMV